MVGEEKRHQMMQNLFGDQSEEEEKEEVESEHESNRQPDYPSHFVEKKAKPCDMEQQKESQTPSRLWRPAAQRNLRNQWSQLASLRQKWSSSSSTARSHATALVNAHLSQRYMKDMKLGVLSDMPNIREKASWKLFKQQERHGDKLLSSYKDMVVTVADMVNISTSLRCFHKGTSSSSLVQFSSSRENENDNGDGGGIPVFVFWPISSFEEVASELVQMFVLELNVKRLLVMELLSLGNKEVPNTNVFCWSDELYPGEFDDLSNCYLYSREACEPVPPKLEGRMPCTPLTQSQHQLDSDVLQVYLTAWLVDVNVDKHREDEIFSIVGEEMRVNLS